MVDMRLAILTHHISDMEPIMESLGRCLTCHMCMGIFADPVTLPCYHICCRSCVQSLFDKMEPTPTDSSVLPFCPTCHEPIVLAGGLPALLEEKRLRQIAELYREEVMYSAATCKVHKQAFSHHCLDCQKNICLTCFPRHNGHRSRDIQCKMGARKADDQRERKIEDLEKRFLDLLKEYDDLGVDIQKQGWEHVLSNRKTDDPALQDKLQQMIEERYVRLHADRLKVKQDLMRDIGQIQEVRKKSFSSTANFQPYPATRMDDYIWKLKISLKAFEQRRHHLMECLENDRPSLEHSHPRESTRREGLTLENVKESAEMKEKVVEYIQEIRTIIDHIKDNENCHVSEIQRAHDEASTSLETWRKSALESVRGQHKKWLDKCETMIGDLQIKLEGMECFVIRSIQDFKEVSVRFNHQLRATEDVIKKQEGLMGKCEKFLKDQDVSFIHLNVTKKMIKKPMLKFTTGDSSTTKITECGFAVEAQSPQEFHDVITDGELQSGQYYWELEVTVYLEDEPYSSCRCIIGLKMNLPVPEKHDTGKTHWGITVDCHEQKFQCLRLVDCNNILPEYTDWKPYPGHHKLGVYLDCEKRTITIVDCCQRQIIWTQGNIDVSKPLAPYVAFQCLDNHQPAVSASIRLITRDNTSLQQILSEVLKRS